MPSYIYLVKMADSVYKVGRTDQEFGPNLRRLQSYPKDSTVVYTRTCEHDVVIAEGHIVQAFREAFGKHPRGNEYFVGSEPEMVRLINSKIDGFHDVDVRWLAFSPVVGENDEETLRRLVDQPLDSLGRPMTMASLVFHAMNMYFMHDMITRKNVGIVKVSKSEGRLIVEIFEVFREYRGRRYGIEIAKKLTELAHRYYPECIRGLCVRGSGGGFWDEALGNSVARLDRRDAGQAPPDLPKSLSP